METPINRSLKANLAVLGTPLIGAIILIVFFIILGRFGYSKVMAQITEFNAAKQAESALEGKVEVLQRLEKSIESSVDKAALALPDKNPAPFALFNMKANAASSFVTIDDFSMVSSPNTDPSEVAISLSISGAGITDFLDYFKNLANYSPIVIIKSVNILGSNRENLGASLTLTSYWAPLPSTIPSVSSPVTELTTEEVGVLEKVAKLTTPSFETILPLGPTTRENPFQ